eukprot:2236142-Prymnesium_polylepis.1
MSFNQLCDSVTKLDRSRRPACIVLCMPHGTRIAAQRLVKAGAPLIVWVCCDIFNHDLAAALLYGICTPLLEAMHEPRASPGLLASKMRMLSAAVLGTKDGDAGLLFPTVDTQHRPVVPLPQWQPSGNDEGLWVHNLATSLPEARGSGRGCSRDELHEQIKLAVCESSSGKQIDVLEHFEGNGEMV